MAERLIHMESARRSRPRGSGAYEREGILRSLYIPGLFLTTASMLITEFPLPAAQEARLALLPAHTRPWLARSPTTGLRLLGSIKETWRPSRP